MFGSVAIIGSLHRPSFASAALRSLRRQPVSGQEGMIGQTGTAVGQIEPAGTVFMHGTLWKAQSASPIDTGAPVRVLKVEGLKLTVEKVTEET